MRGSLILSIASLSAFSLRLAAPDSHMGSAGTPAAPTTVTYLSVIAIIEKNGENCDLSIAKNWLQGDHVRIDGDRGRISVGRRGKTLDKLHPREGKIYRYPFPDKKPKGRRVSTTTIDSHPCEVWMDTDPEQEIRSIQWWAKDVNLPDPLLGIIITPYDTEPELVVVTAIKEIDVKARPLMDNAFQLPTNLPVEAGKEMELFAERDKPAYYHLMPGTVGYFAIQADVRYKEETFKDAGISAAGLVTISRVWCRGRQYSRDIPWMVRREQATTAYIGGLRPDKQEYGFHLNLKEQTARKAASLTPLSPLEVLRDLVSSAQPAGAPKRETVRGIDCDAFKLTASEDATVRRWTLRNGAEQIGPVNLLVCLADKYRAKPRAIVVHGSGWFEFQESLPDTLFEVPSGFRILN